MLRKAGNMDISRIAEILIVTKRSVFSRRRDWYKDFK